MGQYFQLKTEVNPVAELASALTLPSNLRPLGRGWAVTSIDWKAAVAELNDAGVPCADEIEALLAHAQHEGETPIICDYAFGEAVFRNGQLRWPGDEDPPEAYFASDGRCLGLILRNSCEVLDRRAQRGGDERDVRVPEAVLPRGSWLGLFEYLDRICGVDEIASPDWNINAGTTQIAAVGKTETGEVVKALARAGHPFPPAEPNLMQVVKHVFQSRGSDWKTRMLFLPVSFLDLMTHEALGAEKCQVRQALFTQLAITAWRTHAKARQGAAFEELFALFRQLHHNGAAATGDVLDQLEVAARLGSTLLRVSSGTALAYQPRLEDDDHAPYARIAETIEICGIEPHHVLGPRALSAGQQGFLRLQDIDPVYFGKGQTSFLDRLNPISERLYWILRQDRHALRDEQKRHLERLSEALLNTMVRIPGTKKPPQGEDGQGTADVQKEKPGRSKNRAKAETAAPPSILSWANPKEIKLRPTQEREGEFWNDCFGAGNSPGERSPFFTACLRIRLPERP